VEINIKGEIFLLLAEKALFHKVSNMLIIADVHLGKASHFNKSGIPIPDASFKKDLSNLSNLIQKYQAKSVLFLGDLFHSEQNSEWNLLELFFTRHETIQFVLVKGNHDIMQFEKNKIDNFSVTDDLEWDEIIFSHEPIAHDKFVICGHIHPGISIAGRAKQKVTLPCFYKNSKQLVLPAYGSLTGLYKLSKKKNEMAFVVVGLNVLKV
jgi:uncharacterized protein